MGAAASNSNNIIHLDKTWDINHTCGCISPPKSFMGQDLYSNYTNVVPPLYAYALSDDEWKELLSDWKRYTDLTLEQNAALVERINSAIQCIDLFNCGINMIQSAF